MNENANSTTKWLQYLLYVSIAALINIIPAVIPLVSGLSGWVSLAINAASVYLLFRLTDANERYEKAAILYAVPLVISVLGMLGITALSLVGSICSIVAEYQEYKAHGELIEERDPKLADKWNTLFWLQFAVSIIVTMLGSVIAAALVAGGNMDMEAAASMIAAVVAVVALLLKVLYLRYLKNTIQLLENGFLLEDRKE